MGLLLFYFYLISASAPATILSVKTEKVNTVELGYNVIKGT
jgi:hypothetical protein